MTAEPRTPDESPATGVRPNRRAARLARIRAEVKAGTRILDDWHHGTMTGWTYGCRCDECVTERAEYDQGRRRSANPRLRGAVYR